LDFGHRCRGDQGLVAASATAGLFTQKKMLNGCLTLARWPRRAASISGAPNWNRAGPAAGLTRDGRYSTRARCQKPRRWSSSSAPTSRRLRKRSSIFYLLFFYLRFYLPEPPPAPCARQIPFRNNSITSAIAAPAIISTSDNPRSNPPVNWVELRCVHHRNPMPEARSRIPSMVIRLTFL
jgi:hypothetical protein